MDKTLTYILIAVNALFAVGMPIIEICKGMKEDDDTQAIGQAAVLSLLGWGLCIVMLTLLIIKLVKPASWPDNPVYMYLAIALTLIGSLITLRSKLLEVRIKEDGLEIRTVLKKRTFYDYREIELEGKCSNQLVRVTSLGRHLCTFTAKSRGNATMIRRWHEANGMIGMKKS